jgi:hypothetical protein
LRNKAEAIAPPPRGPDSVDFWRFSAVFGA